MSAPRLSSASSPSLAAAFGPPSSTALQLRAGGAFSSSSSSFSSALDGPLPVRPSPSSAPSPSIAAFPSAAAPAASLSSAPLDERCLAVAIRVLNVHFPGYTASTHFLLHPQPSLPSSLFSSAAALSPLPSPSPSSALAPPGPSTPSPPPLSASPSSVSPLSPPPPPSASSREEEKDRDREREREKEREDVGRDWEAAPFKPSAFLSAAAQLHGRPFSVASLTLSSLSCVVVERLQEKRAFLFLHSAFMRLQLERERHGGASPSSFSAFLSSLHALIVSHALLLLQRPELLPERLSSGARQAVSFLLNHCELPSASVTALLAAALSSLPPLRLAPLAQSVFTHLAHDMKEMTFIHPDHWKFTLLPHFIYPWFNGYKIETDSPIGLFLKLTTLPDEPSVGEKFFTAPLHMTDVERLFCMGRLNRKLDKAQELLATAWTALLAQPGSRAGLLTWTSTMLLSNWGRTRMRSQRKSTSNDGFLLNVASVMLRVAEREQLFSRQQLSSIDPLYCLLPSRLDVKEETKICATTHDEHAWLSDFYAQAQGGGRQGGASHSAGMAMASRDDRSRAVSMDEGEEKDEEKRDVQSDAAKHAHVNGAMEASFASSSTAAPSSSLSSASAVSEERKSKFKRARLSLGGLRSRPSAEISASSAAPPHAASLSAHYSASASASPASAAALSPSAPSSPALLPQSAASLALGLPPFLSSHGASSSSSFSFSPSSPRSVPSFSSQPSATPPLQSLLRAGDVSLSSAVDRQYFVDSAGSTHYAIVCNRCRSQDLEGVRLKCTSCKDYDLCASCEQSTFVESLGLSQQQRGVTFACPYAHCPAVGLRERQLRDHVHAAHESDVSLVACPICSANGSVQTVLTQPTFDQHLSKEHCDEHDPSTHVTLKVTKIIPHSHRKYFSPQEPYPLDSLSDLVKDEERALAAELRLPVSEAVGGVGDAPSASAEDNALLAERVSARVVHRFACAHCHAFPIRGVAFRCHHCSGYWLCSECEALGWEVHGHHPAHVFVKFRRALHAGTFVQPEPLLYPSAMLGSYGFSLHTEWFFLTLHTLHVGMLKTCSRYTSLVQSIESESDARKLDSLMKVKLCVDAQLLHPRLLKDTLQLYVAVSRWLAALIDPAQRGEALTLPLCAAIPMEFAALPEYLIEDMADFLLFLSRFSIDTMESMDVTPILHLFVALVAATSYLNNPYLRAKLVEVFCGVAEFPTAHGPGCPSLSSKLTADAFVIAHLMPSLIRLYVDIEHTGSDSQFYDKFNVRHAIAVLMKFLSDFPAHVQCMEDEARDTDLFVRFANSIINDMIYLLDEALIKASQLHEIQAAIAAQRASALSFNQMNARRQEQERAAQISRSLRTAAVLATHTVNLLWTLCLHPQSSAVLLRPEMVDRITASINTYVIKLAGPKRESILVKDSAACSYHHDQWLNVFTDIYLAFKDHPQFRLSVVKDSRCFLAADFHRAAELLEEKKLKGKERVAELHALVQRLEQLSEEVQSDWDELGDVPDEFLDPILNTLMEDPVILPSGVAMDRAVITRHLLNKRIDPFNRQPLDVKDLRDYSDMKRRIEAWKSDMRRRRKDERRGQPPDAPLAQALLVRRLSAGEHKADAVDVDPEGKSREEKERERKREREDEDMASDEREAKEGGAKDSAKRKLRDDNDLPMHAQPMPARPPQSPPPLPLPLPLPGAAAPSLPPSSSASSSPSLRVPLSSGLPSSASLSSLSSSLPSSSLSLLHPSGHAESASSSPLSSSSASLLLSDPSPWLSSASSSAWPPTVGASSLSSATAAIAAPTPLPPFSFTAQQEASPMLLSAISPSPPPFLTAPSSPAAELSGLPFSAAHAQRP